MRTIPGAPAGEVKRWGRSAMARLIAADAAHLVLVSPTLGLTPAFAAARRECRLSVIANGIDAAAARAIADAEGETGLVADDVVRNGPDRVLDAAIANRPRAPAPPPGGCES